MYDFNSALLPAFDLTQFQGMNGMSDGLIGGLDIFSGRSSQVTNSKAQQKAEMRHQMMMAHRRRRKPAQERMGPMSPLMKVEPRLLSVVSNLLEAAASSVQFAESCCL
jgi:hypothetical protein